ncbi:sodium-dependent transporter [soil metagenome]
MAQTEQAEHREQWGTRWGFLFAAIGSAIGLGNIWRFPYIAYTNGGGAFFVPYLFALLTAGIPLLVLEYVIGHKHRGATALSWRRLSRKGEFIGWWQMLVSFIIATYYAVILGWALAYCYFSIGSRWGDDPGAFLDSYLQPAAQPGIVGSLVPGVLIPLLIVWGATLIILLGGVKKGIEAANKVMIPTLFVTFFIVVVRGLTLPGATEGLNALFTPDFSAITDGSVWVAAYGQIFFSISVGFGIMVVYSSYLPRSSDLTNNAFIAGFTNSAFELLAGIGVFGALGFLAVQENVPVGQVADEGTTLAFAIFPEILNQLPAFNSAFAFLFFLSLTLAGMSSLISITEVYCAGLRDKYGLSRRTAVAVGCGASAVLSLVYATEGGTYFLTVADYFINNFGLVLIGLAEAIMVGWVLRQVGTMQRHANELSDIRLGRWWPAMIVFVTPVMLIYMTISNAITTVTVGIPGQPYPGWFLFWFGWVVALAALLLGVVLTLARWDPAVVRLDESERPVYEQAGQA